METISEIKKLKPSVIVPDHRARLTVKRSYANARQAADSAYVSPIGLLTDPPLSKLSAENEPGFLHKVTLSNIDNTIRKITLNPIGRSLVLGGAAGLGTYFLAPQIARNIKALAGIPQKYDRDGNPIDITPKNRKILSIAAGLGALGLSGAASFDSKSPDFGLLTYKMKKKAFSNLESPSFISKDRAYEDIWFNPRLTPEVKSRALDLITSVPPSQGVTSGNLISTAIGTGKSALVGGAIGFVTANALGLPNPGSAALATAVATAVGNNLF